MSVDLEALQRVESLRLGQRLTFMVNRYDVVAADASGRATGPVIGFAEQKRMTLRERVTIYTDDSRRTVLCSFAARQVFDLGATYDVFDGAGAPIGSFRKDFAASLLRSTFHLEQPGSPPAVGRERNLIVALVRRVYDELPLPVHFDFTAQGAPVMSVNRAFAVRDAYQVRIPAPWLDRRLAIAMAIGLDVLMSR
jgi:hypothetical protein